MALTKEKVMASKDYSDAEKKELVKILEQAAKTKAMQQYQTKKMSKLNELCKDFAKLSGKLDEFVKKAEAFATAETGYVANK